MIVPRYYQTEAVDALFSYFEGKDGNPVIAMPTGTGKSLVIALFIKAALSAYRQQRILVLTHVKELIEQNCRKLFELWPTAPAGIYSAGLDRREVCDVTFAGIASVAKKPELFGRVDLVLVDECHLVSAKEDTNYRHFIKLLKADNPLLKVVGLSATPFRLGQGRITDGGLFTDVAYDLTGVEPWNRLVAEGYLAPLFPKRTGTGFDLSEVSIQRGDYNLRELNLAVDREEVTRQALAEMVECSEGRDHWLIFAAGVEHSDHVATMLTEEFDVPAVSIHSKLGDSVRDHRITEFKAGRVRAAVNNNVLTTGFDFPAIDLIGMLRPTTSPGLWVQMLGRGSRPAPGKTDCLVMDFAGNTKRLGPINDPTIPKARGKGPKGEAPVKICPVCDCYNHTRATHCIACGAEFTAKTNLTAVADTRALVVGDLPEVDSFEVTAVHYAVHTKAGSPPSLKVTYLCGLRRFNEWVCLEHVHAPLARHKARQWWRERTGNAEPPDTVAEAMQHLTTLAKPAEIRVWHNRKHPQVMGAVFK
jgi:DNA repair protein RadD